jgi:4-amino-4-deoxychorismate lyase
MSRFFETIRYENGSMPLINLHEERFAYTQQTAWGIILYTSLTQVIENSFQHLTFSIQKNIKYKCRVEYGISNIRVDFSPYHQKEIIWLKLIETDDINYSLKFADRSMLTNLCKGIDDITEILLIKNKLLTDTSFTNIALLDGKQWVTPTKPLFEGVQRNHLLSEGIIFEKDIHKKDLGKFTHIKLFNALVNWDEAWVFDTKKCFSCNENVGKTIG